MMGERTKLAKLVLRRLTFRATIHEFMPGGASAPVASNSLPVVQIRWVHPFIEVLDELGVPSEKLLERARLPVLAIDEGTSLVPIARFWDFVAIATQEIGIDDLGLRAGNRLGIETFASRRESAWTRPGMFRTIERFIEAILGSSSTTDMWIVSRGGPTRRVELCFLGTFGPEHEAFPVAEQFWVALMVRLAGYAAGPNWNPERVNLRVESFPQSALKALVGDAKVRTRQKITSIVFPSQQFLGPTEPFPERGSAIWRRHRRALEDGGSVAGFAGSLRVVLRSYLPDGAPTLERAAGLAGMSVRTLQRRLKREGLSYSTLLEDLRHDLAIHLLRNPEWRAAQVSHELGYRDPAIFTRAFRRWTGQTPTQYRQGLLP